VGASAAGSSGWPGGAGHWREPGIGRAIALALGEAGAAVAVCARSRVEQEYAESFANQEDVAVEVPAHLVVYLASGAADVLSGRNIDVSDDVAHMVARAAEIQEHDLYVMRQRE